MVRNFSNDDFQQCCDLFIQVFNAPPWNDQWTNERAQIRLQDFIDNKRFIGFTFWDNDTLVGAVFAHMNTFYRGDELFIDELFISTAHQRKGYGMLLMDTIETFAKENNCVNITLLTGRGKPSFDFYEKLGYKSSDFIAFMYKYI